MTVRTFRYRLDPLRGEQLAGRTSPPPIEIDSWSIVFMDSTGCVAILSDYGDWSHRWDVKNTSHPDDFREAFIRFSRDYLMDKFSYGDKARLMRVVDYKATQAALTKWNREKYTSGQFDSGMFRDNQDLINVADDEYYLQRTFEDLDGFHDEVGHDFVRHKVDGGYQHWFDVSLPRLKAKMRAEIDNEKEREEYWDSYDGPNRSGNPPERLPEDTE